MIRVLFFDLGLTLLDAQQKPFAHVVEALGALAELRSADGQVLKSCLVSDFTQVTPPLTAARVKPAFDAYLAILEASGLRPYFEPVAKRVTLSTHVGLAKPAPQLFRKALARLGSNASWPDCLLITENADHIKAVRQQLKMQTLQFRAAGSSIFDFEDWSLAPALIAPRLEG